MPVALRIERARVRSLDTSVMEVTWETDTGVVDVLDYRFQVLRSESGEGPFEAITPEFEDRYIFVDRRVPSSDIFRQLWYKIRVRHKATNDTVDFGPYTREAEPDLVAMALRRNQQALFTRVAGRQCWLFPRRTFGTRCTNCWDRVLSAKKVANCVACYDTGFIRGFLNPIVVWAQVDPVAKAVQIQVLQKGQQQMTSARMTSYPVVKPGDVLVEAENKRWRVVGVETSERLRAIVKQTLTLRLIATTDIEYKLPLRLDTALRDVQASPEPQFTNPHNLDNDIEDRGVDVFSYYPTSPFSIPEE